MTDLPEFLLARIAEDENVAQSVQDAPAKSGSDVFTSLSAPTGTVEMSPRRVLADLDAKRQIVQAYRDAWEMAKQLGRAGRDEEAQAVRYGRLGLEAALEALALPYADHPDYRQEWKP